MLCRCLAKTATYRTMNSVYGFAVAYAVSGKVSVAAAVAGAEVVYKMFAYFGHEWIWERLAPRKGLKGVSSLRSSVSGKPDDRKDQP